MNHLVVVLISALGFLAQVNAECANACNGHGKCTSYDMCICHRNWQANDCSERVCMHGLAHVDTPKGDLDGSGLVIAPDTGVVVDNSFQYPYGTTEQFPQMEDSDLGELTNSAHYYMECSNKGICDRSSGLCECFDGYDGVACQRASCPGYPASCSGHGVCKSAKQLAEADGGNVYKLWNKDATMGCECDAGYFGPDCSQRSCKVGVDPLYLDDTSTIKYSIFDFAVLTTDVSGTMVTGADSLFDDGTPLQGNGYWAIKFYDHSGEDWITEPIVAGASCSAVITALESLPNDVIPAGETECYQTTKVNVADNLFVNDRTNDDSSKQDYKITYRMSIWDAYVYKKFGSNFQDVLSVKTKLGNQVYSPLLWLPGSMTQPFAAADHETLYSTPIGANSGSGLKVVDDSGSANWDSSFVAVAAQAEGSGEFYLGDIQASASGAPGTGDNALTSTELGLFVADAVVIVSGAQCGAAGYYTIRTTLSDGAAATLAVEEAIPAQNAGDNCYLTLATLRDLGTGTQMIPVALSGDLSLDATPFTGSGISRSDAASGVALTSDATTAKIVLASAIDETDADFHKIVANQKVQVSGSTCDNAGIYTVRHFDGTNIVVWEDWTSGSSTESGTCTVNLYNDNLPSTATRVPLSGDIYRIKFFGNPGKLKQPEIVTHLDGKRNSLMSTEYAASKTDETSGEPFVTDLVITKVFTDGQQGEDNDYFADHCDGVTVTVNHDNIVADPSVTLSTGYTAEQRYADGNVAKQGKWTLLADATETALLKKCLGDSDMTDTNNVEIHNWDHGSADFPHLIKLVRTVTSITDGGYYVAIYWDSSNSEFVMLNPFTPPDALETDVYEVYTTRGTLARVSSKAQAYFGFGQKTVITTNTQRMGEEAGWDGDVSCEIGANAVQASRLSLDGDSDAASKDDEGTMFINDIETTVGGTTGTLTRTYVKACVNKTDMVTFLNWDYPALNSPKINLYTVDRLVKDKVTRTKKLRYGSTVTTAAGSGNGAVTGGDGFDSGDTQKFPNSYGDMHFGTNVMTLDLSTNWAVELNSNHSTTMVENTEDHTAWASPYYIYKFIPAADSTYEYVAECANRGLCDHETGTCECFTGYTNDACDQQDSLSL